MLEMEKPVNFAEIRIDPAPFQLVEKSNLLKVCGELGGGGGVTNKGKRNIRN